MKKISIVTPTFNEEENIERLCKEIKIEAEALKYNYEHIIIDNCSTDETINKLREISSKDKNVKVIINSRNYGHIKSPFYGIMQSTGDACILMVSDFQEPINLISQYIEKWENGAKIVLGEKNISEENNFMFSLRKLFYTSRRWRWVSGPPTSGRRSWRPCGWASSAASSSSPAWSVRG